MTTEAPLQASKCIHQGQGLSKVLLQRAARLELDWDVRQKSRFLAHDAHGRSIGVILPRGTVLRGGDVLVASDGSLIRIIAAPQSVLRITHCATHGSAFDLLRAAYHLGNRHVPMELQPDHLVIEPDHVLADLLRAMHLIVHTVEQAFEPESGAYASPGAGAGAHHGHSHAAPAPAQEPCHDHDHGHAHPHDQAHAHDCSDPAHHHHHNH